MRWSKQPVLFWKDVKKQNYSQKFLVYLTVVDKHKPGVILPHGPALRHLLLISSAVWGILNIYSLAIGR